MPLTLEDLLRSAGDDPAMGPLRPVRALTDAEREDELRRIEDQPAAPAGNDLVNQFITMTIGAGGGGMGGGFGGTNPMTPIDPLGLGMGGNPLGMGAAGMLNPMGGGIGLDPYQAAGLRLTQSNKMNVLRQNMANQHRGIGRAGGRDFSRHVENINDEMMALQEQKVQNNINNAFRASQDALAWARFNQSQDQDFWNTLMRYMTARGIYGGAGAAQSGSPGTFSGTEGGSDTQGTLP